jgi:hypothetical protein
MMSFRFNSQFHIGDHFDMGFTQDQVKNEPMLFNCSVDGAYRLGGPITRAFLDTIDDDFKDQYAVFDSRTHMLMPGWYPCIPGYHHDDIARNRSDGQPDYSNLLYKSEHVMGLVNGDICPTEFAIGHCEMNDVPLDGVIYEQWHHEVLKHIENGVLKKQSVPSGQLIYFDYETFHTGIQAVGNGWRWFGRLSIKTDRTHNVTNELRQQVQVYLENPMAGW